MLALLLANQETGDKHNFSLRISIVCNFLSYSIVIMNFFNQPVDTMIQKSQYFARRRTTTRQFFACAAVCRFFFLYYFSYLVLLLVFHYLFKIYFRNKFLLRRLFCCWNLFMHAMHMRQNLEWNTWVV